MFNDTVCIIVGMVEKLSGNVFIMIEKIIKFQIFTNWKSIMEFFRCIILCSMTIEMFLKYIIVMS